MTVQSMSDLTGHVLLSIYGIIVVNEYICTAFVKIVKIIAKVIISLNSLKM